MNFLSFSPICVQGDARKGQYGSNKGKASSPVGTQGGFPPECSLGAAPPGNGIRAEASPEALLRGYIPGDFPTGSPPQGLICILPSLVRLISTVLRARGAATFNIFVNYLYKMSLPVFISEMLLNVAAPLARVVVPLHHFCWSAISG